MKGFFQSWPADAWRVLVARAVMMGVNSLLLIALILRVHASGVGPMGNTALMVMLAIPPVALIRIAGSVADRYDSHRILAIALAGQIIAALALAASDNLAWTLGWALVFETGFTFNSPVYLALVPRIVGEARVQGLAGMQMLVSSVAAPLGGALGGVLVDLLGTRTPPLAAAVLVGVAWLVAYSIRLHRHGAAEHADAPAATGGLSIIRADRVLSAILVGGLVLVLVVQGVNVVEVFLVRDELGASATQYGLGEIAFAVGSLAAAILVARMSSDLRRVLGVVLGFGVTSLACVAIGAIPNFPSYLAVVAVLGLSNAAANGALGPLFLLRSPEALRGRVMAALGGSFSAVSIIALLIGGLVGSWLGPRLTFIMGGGLGLIVIVVTAAVVIPAVRRERTPTQL